MAILIDVGDKIQFTIGTYANGQAGLNVTNWRVWGKVGAITLEMATAEFDSTMAPLMKPLLANTASYYGIRGQRLAPGARTVAIVSADFIGVGTAGANILPTQTCGIISTYSLLAGSGNRGRWFIPFPCETDNDDTTGLPTAGYKTKLGNLADVLTQDLQLISGANTVTLRPYIKHAASTTGEDVAGYVAKLKWGTQRKRGSYGQPNLYPPF